MAESNNPRQQVWAFEGNVKKKILSRKIQHDKKYNDTLLLDCIAVLPVCQCMLLSTTITSTLAEFIYIHMKLPEDQRCEKKILLGCKS